ncbi:MULTISPECIES: flagella biosynthesis regulatory protein FliT [Lelliottia]|jgi:flagellar protein FliT|uniref:Flagellar protein FliT n=1 Tax=Lelliottia wanjuensis TaxID=3050585 RepID=A0AAP4D1H5_9ENTR|nr:MULTISPECIES: flagella biosynthesis regulatory protein FliT [unclassified Lelliottia]MDI3363009.1 flagella biosynthesis regulatory protein FliT [Lelliottia sp. V89_13]MDK9356893.1 flagella biosynthesis regulatory protein FliT [Lelliottia sp. V106_16]MDK9363339.1 flagella biosynthesis regulatory protein FliT [Lelliottia sp. V106_12]MDK9372435.1 flagella biosynthesis regulatory protein FliT [Lelliottia sp. V106_10]MDK9550168.1 flagella biosynthesis regulatory protein FliT [Lelliottia sp. V89_
MTNPSTALNDWQALHSLSLAMLKLAHSGQWDELIAHEISYVQLVERISQNSIPSAHAAQIEQARYLLEMVLKNEKELKELLAIRMDELRNLIDQTTKQQSITSAYGKLSGNILYPESLTRDNQL